MAGTNLRGIFIDKVCPICNKEFSVSSADYVYKRGYKYFCSYTCMRTHEKQKARLKIKDVDEYRRIYQRQYYLKKKESRNEL